MWRRWGEKGCGGVLGVCFFQAEDGIRGLVRSRGLGDVYKRQLVRHGADKEILTSGHAGKIRRLAECLRHAHGAKGCLLYTSDAADDLLCVDLGGRRLIKKKTNNTHNTHTTP